MIEIIDDNSNLYMIPYKKHDRVAIFQKIARVKSWVIEMERNLGRGDLGDGPSNRSIFILKIPINLSENSIHYRLNLCPPTLSVNPFHTVSTGKIGEDIHSIYCLELLYLNKPPGFSLFKQSGFYLAF